MATSLTYSDIEPRVGQSFGASASGHVPAQADVAAWIADADARVEIDTGTATESTAREVLVKECVVGMYREYMQSVVAAGGTSASHAGGGGSTSFGDPYREYRALLKTFVAPPNKATPTAAFIAHDFSGVAW